MSLFNDIASRRLAQTGILGLNDVSDVPRCLFTRALHANAQNATEYAASSSKLVLKTRRF